jgi:hypothetical protein
MFVNMLLLDQLAENKPLSSKEGKGWVTAKE